MPKRPANQVVIDSLILLLICSRSVNSLNAIIVYCNANLTPQDHEMHTHVCTCIAFENRAGYTREMSGKAGCLRQVAALYSDHYRQVTLDQGRLAVLDRCIQI